MCGIVGYVGGRQAYPILVKGLTRLEYRGYDSAGVALVNDNGDLVVYKTKGKVKDLERTAEGKDVSGTVGIAHTRWATHGEPSDVNSHPHYSENHELALIHNGIIENYQALKTELTRKGYHFRSQTDTEVVIQLIQYMMDSLGVSFDEAVPLALNNVVGAYALVIMDKREPDKIIAARKGSPLPNTSWDRMPLRSSSTRTKWSIWARSRSPTSSAVMSFASRTSRASNRHPRCGNWR